jgi:hypothetical protein
MYGICHGERSTAAQESIKVALGISRRQPHHHVCTIRCQPKLIIDMRNRWGVEDGEWVGGGRGLYGVVEFEVD